MMKSGAVWIVVQARMNSSRLPGKVMLRAAGKPFLGHVLRRLHAVDNAAGVVVATTVNAADDAIARYCTSVGVPFFRGSENDVLARIHAASAARSAEAIVRITADCPLIDPKLIAQAIDAYRNSPGLMYLSNTLKRRLPRGMDVEVISMRALTAACSEATSRFEREHVTPFIRRYPDRFPAMSVESPFSEDLSPYRFTLDTQEDLLQLRRLLDLLQDQDPLIGVERLMAIAKEHGLLLRDAHFPRQDALEFLDQQWFSGRIGLGAAQFGANYGSFNQSGRPSTDQVELILRRALDAGFCVIDTARSYGESEMVLGKLSSLSHQFRVVTKTRVFDEKTSSKEAEAAVVADAEESLKQLRRKSVYGLLAHGPENLLRETGAGIYRGLMRMKESGSASKIGASVYSPAQLKTILERYELDLVQLPINVLSQDFLDSGMLAECARRNIEVHARSVFLQGLLLLEFDSIPPFFERLRPALAGFSGAAKARGLTPAAAALAYVLGLPEISIALAGFESPWQLEQLLAQLPPALDVGTGGLGRFEVADPRLVLPINWS